MGGGKSPHGQPLKGGGEFFFHYMSMTLVNVWLQNLFINGLRTYTTYAFTFLCLMIADYGQEIGQLPAPNSLHVAQSMNLL